MMTHEKSLVESVNRSEISFILIVTLISTSVAIKFFLMKFGISSAGNLGIFLSGAALTTYSYFDIKRNCSSTRTFGIQFVAALCALSALVYVAAIYWKGVTLPANDPIADPTFSSVLERGITLNHFYAIGDSGHSYPPGVPLLLSFLMSLGGNITTLISFKALCLVAVALMPLTWAWGIRRLLGISTPLKFIVPAFYVSAFAFERTLNYALPFAGKNSQLIMLMLLPAFLVKIQAIKSRNAASIILSGMVFLGIILIHYSAIHLTFVMLVPIYLIKFFKEKRAWRSALADTARPLIICTLGITFFLLLFPDALHDPRSTLGGSYDFRLSITHFFEAWLEPNTSMLAIFNDTKVQAIGSPARGYILIGCVLFCWLAKRAGARLRRNSELEGIFTGAACLFLSLIAAMIMGSGLINTGASLDFTRWFIFPIQFSLIGLAVVSIFLLIRNLRFAWSSVLLALAFAIASLTVLYRDTIAVKRGAGVGVLTKSNIIALQKSFPVSSDDCFIISPNTAAGQNTFAQKYRIMEYAEMVTHCTMVLGSWVHGASPGWRDKDGLPRSTAYAALPGNARVYFVGSADEREKYGKGQQWNVLKDPFYANAGMWERSRPLP